MSKQFILHLGAEGGDHVEEFKECHFSSIRGDEDIHHSLSKRILLQHKIFSSITNISTTAIPMQWEPGLNLVGLKSHLKQVVFSEKITASTLQIKTHFTDPRCPD